MNTPKPIFVPFIMAGYPNEDVTLQALMQMHQQRCDIIELGVPFSDPVADGEQNQIAAKIALDNGTTLTNVLKMVAQTRQAGNETPIFLFSYLNPILAMGFDQFAKQAKRVGVNGVLIVDLPPEEGSAYYSIFREYGLQFMLLISPTTEPARYHWYHRLQPDFLYYISRCGVTGTQQELSETLETEIKQLRQHFSEQRILIGFGISNLSQASTAARLADGFVVGSWLVQTLGETGLAGFSECLAQLRAIERIID